jgi:hypothetical protein
VQPRPQSSETDSGRSPELLGEPLGDDDVAIGEPLGVVELGPHWAKVGRALGEALGDELGLAPARHWEEHWARS